MPTSWANMKVLYIGGTGEISYPCVLESLSLGHEVTVLNRRQTDGELPNGVRQVRGDLDGDTPYAELGEERFDSVCQFFAFETARVARDIETFRGRTDQYVFISTASAYEKPIDRFEVITEQTRVHNPFWEYSQKKIAMEQMLRSAQQRGDLAVTIVRPSHTYRRRFPSALGGGYWTAERMLAGLPILVHGDGTSLWTLTHSSEFARPFARLLGNPRALGEDFHITRDDAYSWDQILTTMARTLGVEPHLVHVASDTLVRYEPSWKGPLHGDKAPSTLFDNTKVKGVAGDFAATVNLEDGFHEAAVHVRAKLETGLGRNPELDALVERIIAEQPGPAGGRE